MYSVVAVVVLNQILEEDISARTHRTPSTCKLKYRYVTVECHIGNLATACIAAIVALKSIVATLAYATLVGVVAAVCHAIVGCRECGYHYAHILRLPVALQCGCHYCSQRSIHARFKGRTTIELVAVDISREHRSHHIVVGICARNTILLSHNAILYEHYQVAIRGVDVGLYSRSNCQLACSTVV